MTSPHLRKSFAVACALAIATVANAVTVAVKDRAILLDGKPTKLWGIRVASASQTQELTDKLLVNLDDYRAHGVNALAVFYMGSLGKYEDPFSPDGRSIDAGHRARMDAIIRACNDRGIVVVVGVFYQRSDKPQLKDWAAATNAIRTAVDAVRSHPNVIFNIANEQNSEHYEDTPWRQVRDPKAVLELCRVARAADPKRVIGAGGYDHAKNEIIGRSADVDLLLYDTKDEDNAAIFRRFVAAGVNKPMVNIELFGGWTKRFQPPGVFPEDGKRRHLEAIDQALAHEHLHIFFHSSPWFQGTADPKPREPLHFHLGGHGTPDDRGVRWFFERVKEVASTRPPLRSAFSWDALHLPTIEVAGFAPYYRDARRNALAIAANRHPDAVAAAQIPFHGIGGRYDLTLVTLTERDGESTYTVKVNGRLVGQVQNPAAADDHEIQKTWPVTLSPGDIVQVESNSVSNRRVPERDSFGYARGRWRKLILTPASSAGPTAQTAHATPAG